MTCPEHRAPEQLTGSGGRRPPAPARRRHQDGRPQQERLRQQQQQQQQWRRRRRQQQQQGAALIVGLVLLAVLTMLGVTGVATSTLDLRMMSSAREALNAFEATESALSAAINADTPITLDENVVPGDEVRAPVSYDLFGDGTVTSTALTTFTGTSNAVPIGWEAGKSVTVHFQVDSATEQAQRGANADNTAGFYIVAPTP